MPKPFMSGEAVCHLLEITEQELVEYIRQDVITPYRNGTQVPKEQAKAPPARNEWDDWLGQTVMSGGDVDKLLGQMRRDGHDFSVFSMPQPESQMQSPGLNPLSVVKREERALLMEFSRFEVMKAKQMLEGVYSVEEDTQPDMQEKLSVAVDAQDAPVTVAEKQAMAGGVTPGEPEFPWWKGKSGEEIRDKLREQGVKEDPTIARTLQTYGITLSEIGRVLRPEGHFDSEDANKKRAQRLLAG